jgi:hypothetical protein
MAFSSDYTVRPTPDEWVVIHKPSQKVIRGGFWCARAGWDYIWYILLGNGWDDW